MTVTNLTPVAEKAGVELAVKGEPSIITGKSQLLTSIVFNLCDNAIKYNRPGGRVEVEVKNCVDCVKLSVSDTGIGIPQIGRASVGKECVRRCRSRWSPYH